MMVEYASIALKRLNVMDKWNLKKATLQPQLNFHEMVPP